MQELLETFDKPVNISEWLNAKPFFHRVGGKRLSIADSAEQHLQTLCAMPYALCRIIDPNRGLPSVLCETDASNNITAYYVYGLGLISKIEGTNAYFYQYDGIGSTVALTDKNANLKNKYAYDDFGNLATNSSETIANPFRYVGKFGVQTDLPDLLYMRARYYVPSVGRFITHDPIGGLNLYAYVGNNPINFMDPKGEQSVIEGVAIPAAIIAIIAATIAYLSNNSKRRYYEIRVDSKPRECPKAPRDPCVVMTIACVGALQQKHFGAAFLYCAVMAVVCGMRIFFR